MAAVGVQRRRTVGKAHAGHRNSKTDYFNRVQQGAPKNKALLSKCFIFIQSEGLVWNHRAKCGVWNPSQSDGMASRASVHLSFGLIPYKANALFTYRRQTADSIHAFGVIL